jgi:tRNA U34 5-methylaminomethyl-2-thiouridine-forming methyltransferase MnmC
VSLKIIITADGSHSIFNETLNETYHSVHGAIQESLHVFIKNGLEVLSIERSEPISILEVGFGTGLNALLSYQYACKHQIKVSYNAIEPSPLSSEIWSQLNHASTLDMMDQYHKLHSSSWGEQHVLDPYFTFCKHLSTIQHTDIKADSTDLIYYDAFAPSKQPEIWDYHLLEKIFHALKPKGLFVTYCAKGELKRNLTRIGFEVETLPGPPGKKEMVRAIKAII